MPWLFATFIGIALGVAVGYVVERVPVAPVLRSVAAAWTSMVLGAIAMLMAWPMFPRQTPDAGVVGFAVGSGSLVQLVGVPCVLAAVLHIVLGQFKNVAPSLIGHRPIVLGCLGALCGTLSLAWVMADALRGIEM
jgi:hypothetical protein